jgi:hypothetical protein
VIVAVDFDGVVNAVPRDEADLAHFERWDRRQVMGFLLTVAGEVLDWLTSLDERGGEFHWATTWTPNRHLLEAAFGLPADAPVAADPDARVPGRAPGVTWKGAQVAALLTRDPRPLVWIDDDAITEPTAAALDALATRLDQPMLGVVPTLGSGLRPDAMATVDDFLARAPAGEVPRGLRVHRAT